MRNCIDCGKKLGFFERGNRCKNCKSIFEAEQTKLRKIEQEKKEQLEQERIKQLSEIENYIINNCNISEDHSKFLKTWNKRNLLDLYNRVYNNFEKDHELNEKELVILGNLQEICGLSNDDIEFNERIRPYHYALMIREKHSLPKVNLNVGTGAPVILKKGEIIHFVDSDGTTLKETRMIKLGYSGGSHGVSFPIPGLKGFRYRVGSHRGHIMKEEKLVKTSGGFLIITNERLFLYPAPGNKPVSIPLKKIISYNAYNNGLEVYKEGREKGYFFAMGKSGSVELAGLCLSFLLGQKE